MESKYFKVKKLTNGRGDKHLVAVIDEAVSDVKIGTVVIIPYVEGFIDPKKVLLQTDENGVPKLANKKFGIVLEYVY